MEEIKVIVIRYEDRKNLLLRYTDPLSGKRVTKSAGTNKMSDAVKAAGKWEDELRSGRYVAPSKTTWEDFTEKYEDEVLPGLAESTQDKAGIVFNAVETILKPKLVRDMTAERLSYFQSQLRENGCAESTIAGYLAYLQASLRYAVEWGMLPKAPKVPRIQRAKVGKTMKGRPITLEEFERMLAKVDAGLLATHRRPEKRTKGRRWSDDAITRRRVRQTQAVGPLVDSWKFYLRGLWASGLRLAESLDLYWDRDDRLCVDLSGKHPMLRIPGALEKGNQDRLLPMAPEFARFLADVPHDQRSGPVFNPRTWNDPTARATADTAGRIISAIGEAAGVVVNKATKAGKAVTKYASAHDLRRSFGERWASRVMPQVLMQLMRHESIETTLRFYVGRNAQSTAAVLWEADNAAGNTKGNNAPTSDTAR